MRIIQSCGSSSWGGLEMTALKTAVHLLEKGHDIAVFCRKNSRLQSEVEKNNIKSYPVFNSKYNIFQSILEISKILSAQQIDVIHTHLSHDLWSVSPALYLSHKQPKLFLTKHMASGVSKKDIFHYALYKKLTGIFAISHFIRDNVVNTCPVEPHKVHILHNSLPVDKINIANYNTNSVKKKYGIPAENLVTGMIGRLTQGKGIEDFLHSIKLLENRTNIPVTFIIAGDASYGEHEYAKSIFKLCNDLDLSNKVKFTGFVEDVPELLSIFDVLVFPSHDESFGISLIEAMAMTVPVIASNNSGIPDIVVDGVTGILIPPKTPEKIAESLMLLFNDWQKRVYLGQNGRKRIEDIFNDKKNFKILEEFYNGKKY